MDRKLAEKETEGIQPKKWERKNEIPFRHSQGSHAHQVAVIAYPRFVQVGPYHPIVSHREKGEDAVV